VVGMTTAMVSMNAVVIHWAVAAPTLNSRISCGSATLMIVSLRITTKAETTSSQTTRMAPAGSPGSVGVAGAPACGAVAVMVPRWGSSAGTGDTMVSPRDAQGAGMAPVVQP
jgi:hypothetical protein